LRKDGGSKENYLFATASFLFELGMKEF
jgi:hypothetical protein